ncbi:hypothetical protein EON65_58920 [archaeon]|nr:MAG: hypothetical protein EON65_58920 [archaeon]
MGVTGINVPFFKLSANIQRVLFSYGLMFKHLPIVIIRVPERQAGELYAQVTSAAHALSMGSG